MDNPTILLILLMLAVGCGECHPDPAYSHDAQPFIRRPDWMRATNPAKFIYQMSIPGTHGSMTYSSSDDSVKCQAKSLPNQLESGIRALDIGLGLQGTTLQCYYGVVQLQHNFSYVLDTIKTFLNEHPQETIFVRIHDEFNRSPVPNPAFVHQVNVHLDRVIHFLWRQHTRPYLGDLFQKFVILDDFTGVQNDLTEFGLNWGKQTLFSIQNMEVMAEQGLYAKWQAVNLQLIASKSIIIDGRYFVNFLSGATYPTVDPYFVASGHDSAETAAYWKDTDVDSDCNVPYPEFNHLNPSCFCPACACLQCDIYYEGTNILFTRAMLAPGRTGIVFADFPGDGLIQAIVSSNLLP